MPASRKSKIHNAIRLRGVRHNNLKGFDLDLPVGQLLVVTGLSGSGKSSLAFDTLYAEGQRRYIETFSPYARQFFDRMDKPQVDSIEGIPPAIAIEQRNTVRSTRSTVGTMTEICDHMKVAWRHIAQLHCRGCGMPVRKESPQTVWKSLNSEPGMKSAECLITFNLALSAKLSLAESLDLVRKQGYQRILQQGRPTRIDEVVDLSTEVHLPSGLTVIQDRLRLTSRNRTRFIEACEQAYHFGKGRLTVHQLKSSGPGSTHSFSAGLHCASCNLDYAAPSPALFSFNHPLGACPACKGFGRIITIDYNLALPDRSKTLAGGAVKPWQSGMSADCQRDMMKFCRARGVPTRVPFIALSEEHQQWILQGDPDYGVDEEHEWPRAWYGIRGYFRWLESKAYKMHVRVLLSRYRAYTLCPDCRGARLQPEALLYQVAANVAPCSSPSGPSGQAKNAGLISLADFYGLPIRDAIRVIHQVARTAETTQSGVEHALGEVQSRLSYLNDIGLGYLTLDRTTRSLSGGETERVNLASCLGTRLVNTLFVLDEPSVGLHPRDTDRLVGILEALRNEGNTVVVVEHERSVMEAADQIIDLGPGHGATGGDLVFQGTHARILASKASLTGRYLSGRVTIPIRPRRPVQRPPALPEPAGVSAVREARYDTSVGGASGVLTIQHANCHNLKNLSLEIPLNHFVCVSGVSGSGKSTLIRDVLLPALQAELGSAADGTKASDRMDKEEAAAAGPQSREPAQVLGAEQLSGVVLVDQSSLGKTPRSNPAVYTGAFDPIRELFARTEDALSQGLNASAFSFNSAQGQCERCRGAGFEKVEMQFLSDVFLRCPDCNGRRYREHILEVKIQGSTTDGARAFSIADLLESTVDEALRFLQGLPGSNPATKATRALRLLQDVGLGYLQLGQPINTLSGGESQRLKLVRHLADSVVAVEDHGDRSAGGRRIAPPPPSPTLFLLDEPTTGLHFEDVRILIEALQRLVDAGHSLLVVEHNLDVLKCADWIVDLGPDAGDAGGELVVAGPPETVATCRRSHTGRFLCDVLKAGSRASKPSRKGGEAQ
jgi:excinuclease ABC subunit A